MRAAQTPRSDQKRAAQTAQTEQKEAAQTPKMAARRRTDQRLSLSLLTLKVTQVWRKLQTIFNPYVRYRYASLFYFRFFIISWYLYNYLCLKTVFCIRKNNGRNLPNNFESRVSFYSYLPVISNSFHFSQQKVLFLILGKIKLFSFLLRLP